METQRLIRWRIEKTTRPELFTIIKENNIGKVYFIDDLAAKYGHTVLRLPPYYCVLNPIEMVWSQLKHKISKVNNTSNLGESVIRATRESGDEIDSVLWSFLYAMSSTWRIVICGTRKFLN
jgi:transposase